MNTPPRASQAIKLSLRELFLLVVIAAMGCGWWVEHRRVETTLEKVEAERQIILGVLEHRRTMFELKEKQWLEGEMDKSANRLAHAEDEARRYKILADRYRTDAHRSQSKERAPRHRRRRHLALDPRPAPVAALKVERYKPGRFKIPWLYCFASLSADLVKAEWLQWRRFSLPLAKGWLTGLSHEKSRATLKVSELLTRGSN